MEAWAGLKSFQEKGSKPKTKDTKDIDDPGNPSVDFKGKKRSNDTHESTTDSESRLYTKAAKQTAKLSYMGHVLMENRNGLAVGAEVRQAGYAAKTDAALQMVKNLVGKRRKTLGGDKHYDQDVFCDKLRKQKITPHIAQNIHARRFHSAVDERETHHKGYEVSQRK